MRTLCLLAAILVATAEPAWSDPVVLGLNGVAVYVDLGGADGVGAGSVLELLREVVVKDPVTGGTLRDRFALGKLTVIKSGERLSLAVPEPSLARRVAAGDPVRLVSPKQTYVDPWGAPPAKPSAPAGAAPAASPAAPQVDHLELVRQAWQASLGKPELERVARWQALLQADPQTPYRTAIEREIATLRQQHGLRESALARDSSTALGDRGARVAELAAELERSATTRNDLLASSPWQQVAPAQPLTVAFLVRKPARIGRAWLFVRPPGEPGFQRLDLVADGDAYLRAVIAAPLVRAPQLEWYVEAELRSARDGGASAAAASAVTPILGSAQAPQRLLVEAGVREAPIAAGRSHIDAHVDYVDFDGGLADGFDQYYQAELDFTYRFLDPVYAVRLGFGTLSGTGGPKDVIDADTTNQCLDGEGTYACRRVTFSYVYSEIEVRLVPAVALLLRPQLGLLTTDEAPSTTEDRCRQSDDLRGCGFGTRLGGRARIRFGSETGTNLAIGAGFTRGVGTLLEAAYQWLPMQTLPVQLVVQVTDMPVPEDLGVRLVADVGWRQLAWFYPSVRVSYQARDIDHAGFSGGLAMNFDW